MNPNDPNVVLLERVAAQLGETLGQQLVFVGGAVAGLLITDPAMPSIRSTQDVDVVCSVLTLADYYRIAERLRAQGFKEDARPGAPNCRWCFDDVAVDVMPTRPDILGFSNRWYPLALSSAQQIVLPSGRLIRLVTAPVFVATKLEAFHGRGRGDYLFSHDLEDIVSVADGRASLIDECRQSPFELRCYLAEQFTNLMASGTFIEAISGHLPGDAASQRRLPGVQQTLRQMAELARP